MYEWYVVLRTISKDKVECSSQEVVGKEDLEEGFVGKGLQDNVVQEDEEF